MSKAQLLQGLREENAAWEAFLQEIGEDRMDTPDVAGSWSIKDIIAHITGWRRYTADWLETGLQRGGRSSTPPPWPAELQTDDEINDWIYNTNKDKSVQEVLQDSRATFQRILDAFTAMPEEDMERVSQLEWFGGEPFTAAGFFGHFHDEHEPDMRAWLSKQQAR